MDRFFRLARTALAASALLSGASAAFAGVTDSIDAILRDPYLKEADVGIKVVRLGKSAADSKIVYERNAGKPLVPASNLKLVTTAAALDGLGADFQFHTRLLQKGQTLALVGDGDPTFGDAVMLKKLNLTSTSLIEQWADAMKQHGITSADQFLFDDNIFDNQFQHPNWPADQLHKWYGAGVGGINFNVNCIDFYLQTRGMGQVVNYQLDPQTQYATITNTCVQGTKNAVWLSRELSGDNIELKGQTDTSNIEALSITVADPSAYGATVVRETLEKKGIKIAGAVTRDLTIAKSKDPWREVLVNETPITAALARANKDSMNMYAEALCKRLGAKESGQPGSWSNGTAAIGRYLNSLGIPANEFNLDDGCGLSKKNKISPEAFVAVLEKQYFSSSRDIYLSSLAVAGVDGTLKKRFDGTALNQRVFGKSGSINKVSTLSGYINGRDGNWYVFSILFNDIPAGTNPTAHALQEKIVLSVDR